MLATQIEAESDQASVDGHSVNIIAHTHDIELQANLTMLFSGNSAQVQGQSISINSIEHGISSVAESFALSSGNCSNITVAGADVQVKALDGDIVFIAAGTCAVASNTDLSMLSEHSTTLTSANTIAMEAVDGQIDIHGPTVYVQSDEGSVSISSAGVHLSSLSSISIPAQEQVVLSSQSTTVSVVAQSSLVAQAQDTLSSSSDTHTEWIAGHSMALAAGTITVAGSQSVYINSTVSNVKINSKTSIAQVSAEECQISSNISQLKY